MRLKTKYILVNKINSFVQNIRLEIFLETHRPRGTVQWRYIIQRKNSTI